MKNMQERGVYTSVLMVPTLILAVSLCAVASGNNDVTLSGLPIAAQSSISAAVGRDTADYQPRAAAHGFTIENSRQRWEASFTSGGIVVHDGAAHWAMNLKGYGYGDALTPATATAPRAKHNRVEYPRGNLTEWYVNGPVGLEQGFTIEKRPRKISGEPLTIELAVSGDMKATIDQNNRRGLTLTGHGSRFRYAGLFASDKNGEQLEAWLELRGERVLLRVSDHGARYPLVIDPVVQVAELNSAGETGEDEFGQSAAISGNTVVVGAPNVTINGINNSGAAYVFVEPASGWGNMTQTAVLTPSSGATGGEFGLSVGIEGNTIVVGSPGLGTLYVFIKPSTGWTNMTETAQLTASDATSDLGASVQISGNTIVAGAPFRGIGGAVYVFVKPSTGWSNMTQTAELTASDVAAGDFLGNGVGISGNVIAAGAPGFGNKEPTGAAYVFVEPAGGWSDMMETAKLTASNGGGTDYFGTSIAVSSGIVVVGAIAASVGNHKDVGAAYVFVEATGGWSSMTQTAILTPLLTGSEFGLSTAISGNVIVVTGTGSALVFVKPVRGWRNTSKYAEVLAPSGIIGNFGFSVGISGDTVVASGPGSSASPLGAALVFGP